MSAVSLLVRLSAGSPLVVSHSLVVVCVVLFLVLSLLSSNFLFVSIHKAISVLLLVFCFLHRAPETCSPLTATRWQGHLLHLNWLSADYIFVFVTEGMDIKADIDGKGNGLTAPRS